MFDHGFTDLIHLVFVFQILRQYSVFDLLVVFIFVIFLSIRVVREWVGFFVLFKFAVLLI